MFWALGTPPADRIEDNALALLMPLHLCDEHKEQATAEGFVSEEGWSRICIAAGVAGRAQPDRASAKITWELVGETLQ